MKEGSALPPTAPSSNPDGALPLLDQAVLVLRRPGPVVVDQFDRVQGRRTGRRRDVLQHRQAIGQLDVQLAGLRAERVRITVESSLEAPRLSQLSLYLDERAE